MSNAEKAIIEKRMNMLDLLPNLFDIPMLVKYFDIDSNEMLDEKIKVLKELGEGKNRKKFRIFTAFLNCFPRILIGINCTLYMQSTFLLLKAFVPHGLLVDGNTVLCFKDVASCRKMSQVKKQMKVNEHLMR